MGSLNIKTRTAELMSLHRGQGMDIIWRDTLRCPTEDEYVEMVKDSMYRHRRRKHLLNIDVSQKRVVF